MGHMAHRPRSEGEGYKVSDGGVQLNADEGGISSNPVGSSEVTSDLSQRTNN